MSGKARYLAISLIVLNIVALVVALAGVRELYDYSIRESEIASQNLAQAVGMGLSSEVSKIELSITTVVADLKELGASSFAERRDFINELIRRQKTLLPEVEGWSVTDREGNATFHDSLGVVSRLYVGDREYFQALRDTGSGILLVSKPLLSRKTGALVVVFAQAIQASSGDFAGVAMVLLPTAYFNRLVSGFLVDKRAFFALRDSDLGLITQIVSNKDGDFSAVRESPVSVECSAHMAEEREHGSCIETTPSDQEERIVSYRKLDNAPMTVFVGLSKDDALAAWRRTAWRFLGFAGLLLFAANGAILLLYRWWMQKRQRDILLQASNKRLEASLQALKEQGDALVAAQEAGKMGAGIIDLQSETWFGSEQLHAIFGVQRSYPHTLDGWRKIVHVQDRAALTHHVREEVAGKRCMLDYEHRIMRPSDGRVLWVHCLAKPEFDARGRLRRLSGVVRDISERKFAEERMRLSSEVFQNVSEGILVLDRFGAIVETNLAFTRITGYAGDEIKGRQMQFLNSGAQDRGFYTKRRKVLLEQGFWEGELVNRRKDGRAYVQYSRISAIRNEQGRVTHFCATIADITELKDSQRRLEYLAFHDELTCLPNRSLLADRLRQSIEHCKRRRNGLLVVCYMDVDGFKEINDQWGHARGDRLLVEVANRLGECTRANDTVARLGGDEFVVVFTDMEDEAAIEKAVDRLLQRIASEPFRIGRDPSPVTVSIGVTVYPYDASEEPDALLRHADQAMYEAKHSGKNRVRFFDLESDRRVRERQQVYDRLTEALGGGDLCLHYQPKVDLRTGAVRSLEALLRWRHPDAGLLLPGEFLPAIENTDLTLPIGEWVLHTALQQKRRWLEQGLDICVSVNVFPAHLQREDFAERLLVILSAYPDIDPGGLELEILETTAFADLSDIVSRLRACVSLGVQFSLDDFGTGFSSLTYLQQLPAGTVKIDRSFVQRILDDQNDQALVQGIVGMAHTLGRKVVAEGVETNEHGVVLLRCGCDIAQGYGVARPMPPEAIPDWIAAWRMPASWSAAAASEVLYFGKEIFSAPAAPKPSFVDVGREVPG